MPTVNLILELSGEKVRGQGSTCSAAYNDNILGRLAQLQCATSVAFLENANLDSYVIFLVDHIDDLVPATLGPSLSIAFSGGVSC